MICKAVLVIFFTTLLSSWKLSYNNIIFLCVVEEPSYDFIRLRDYVDALDCSKLSAFAPDDLRNGFSDKMVQQAREELKINKVSNNIDSLVRQGGEGF